MLSSPKYIPLVLVLSSAVLARSQPAEGSSLELGQEGRPADFSWAAEYLEEQRQGKRQFLPAAAELGAAGSGAHKFVDRDHGEWLANAISEQQETSTDFDQIIGRILSEERQPKGDQLAAKVHADANNKTTMRFFRNNKTFASIVYTNENNAPAGSGRRPARRLINCHLVDLERHWPDVAQFESKYGVRTAELEFRDMMQLIEQCTNIARLKPVHQAHQQPQQQQQHSLHPNVAQLFAASLPDRNSVVATGGGGHKHCEKSTAMLGTPLKPVIVVGRPSAAANQGFLTPASSKAVAQYPQLSYKPGPTPPTHALSAFKSIKIEFAPANYATSGGRSQPSQTAGQQLPRLSIRFAPAGGRSLAPAGSLLEKAREGSKRLVLGEVTPAPNSVEKRPGGIKEALQEITSYDTSDLVAIWRGILPGTNWCGMGDRATSYNDLGFEADIDICCRAHDFCPIRLSAFSGGYGLFNWSFYTRSHCWCDQNFLDCLQRASSPLSSVVMKIYFTMMKTTCLHNNDTEQQQAAQLSPQSTQHTQRSLH